MTSERRWLDENAPEPVRLLLESAELDEPTATQLESLRAKVAPLFDAPPPSSPPADPGPPAAPPVGTAGALAGKLVVGVALLAVGGGVGLWLGKRDAPVPPEPLKEGTRVEAALPPRAPAERKPEPEPEPVPPPAPTRPSSPVVVKKAPPPPPPAPAPVSEDEELAQLQAAMAAPNATESLALLERHATRFPQSSLGQEREVLTVKALMQLERVDEARARAKDFKARWPTSPHLLRVEALVGK